MHTFASLFWVIASLGLAFIVGFAIQRGSVCAVVAAKQLVLRRRWSRTRAYLVAACWSLVVLVPLAWLLPEQIHLADSYPVTALLLGVSALYGLGAYINGSCAFGTLSGLTRGNLNYAATVVGIFFGAALSSQIGPIASGSLQLSASSLSQPSTMGLVVLILALAVVLHAVSRHYKYSRRWSGPLTELLVARRWRVAPSVAILGVAGGLLYAAAGDWTYMAVLSERAASLTQSSTDSMEARPILATLAVVSGGVLAAKLSGRFAWRRANVSEATRKVLGGAVMSFAAASIPGGNDMLLLYGLPSLSLYAIAAYVTMITTLCMLIYLSTLIRRRAA